MNSKIIVRGALLSLFAGLSLACLGAEEPAPREEQAMDAGRCTQICAEAAWSYYCEAGGFAYSDVEAECGIEISNGMSPAQISGTSVDDCENWGVSMATEYCTGGGGGGGGGSGMTGSQCYDAGWLDCEDYLRPDAGAWSCTGESLSDAYEDGYCDCEGHYNDWVWC